MGVPNPFAAENNVCEKSVYGKLHPPLRLGISNSSGQIGPVQVGVGQFGPLEVGPAEAVYVGDHLRDIEAGRGAGMYTIAAAYGYIEPDDDPAAWGADAQADHSTALHRLILPDN